MDKRCGRESLALQALRTHISLGLHGSDGPVVVGPELFAAVDGLCEAADTGRLVTLGGHP